MRKILLGLLTAITMVSCTNKKGATEALKDAGYHPIEVGGFSWFGCGENDFYKTRFKAYNNDSTRIVTGQVCQGLLKGKTIRLD